MLKKCGVFFMPHSVVCVCAVLTNAESVTDTVQFLL